MSIPQVVTAFNAFVGGDLYSGIVNKATIPAVVFSTIEKDIAGYAGAIEVFTGRVDKMESEITFDSFAAPKIFAMIGNPKENETPVIMRGSIRSGNQDVSLKVTMQGLWKEWSGLELTAKAEVANTFKVSLTKLVVEVNSEELLYINIPTFDTRVRGVDIGSKIKANIGL